MHLFWGGIRVIVGNICLDRIRKQEDILHGKTEGTADAFTGIRMDINAVYLISTGLITSFLTVIFCLVCTEFIQIFKISSQVIRAFWIIRRIFVAFIFQIGLESL